MDNPNLVHRAQCQTVAHDGGNDRMWYFYGCGRCGGIVTASAVRPSAPILEIFPETNSVNEEIPSPAREYLSQAYDTIHAPAGSIMLSASAVDAMLKEKEYNDGSLFSRINQAVTDHLITEGMAEWAHRVRLDPNSKRPADQKVELPTPEDAQQTLDFVTALGQFLFVLPARVQRGLEETEEEQSKE